MKTLYLIGCMILMACSSNQNTDTRKNQKISNILVKKDSSIAMEDTFSYQYTEPAVVDYLPTKEKQGLILFNQFYPIGWSKNGKVAFVELYAQEAADIHQFGFTIIDAASNKIVFEKKYEIDYDAIPMTKNNFKFIWKMYYAEWQPILKKNEILPAAFSLETTNPIGDVLIHLGAIQKMDTIMQEKFVHVIHITTKKAGTTKTIYFKNYKSDASFIYETKVAGVWKSPHEDKGLLIVKNLYRGWEGPPNVYRMLFCGLALN